MKTLFEFFLVVMVVIKVLLCTPCTCIISVGIVT